MQSAAPSRRHGWRLQAGGEWTDEKTSQIRRITAKRLLESKTTIPHYYLTVECKVRLDSHLVHSSGIPCTSSTACPCLVISHLC